MLFGYKRKKIEWLNSQVDELQEKLDKAEKELSLWKEQADITEKTIQKYKEILEEIEIEKKEILDAKEKEHQDISDKIDAYDKLLRSEIENSKSLVETNKVLTSIIVTQQSSISALAEGIYNQEHIEFFALKTYRGWKYICCDGVKYTDFTNAKNVSINWNQGGRVELNIN